VELSFRIKFSLSRKLKGYELPAISKWHNVSGHCGTTEQKTNRNRNENFKTDIYGIWTFAFRV
jgi:hypothetical protein